ncbi:adipokinetic hormone [Condylostylus longicornis]|uniref:adipokinetic hormone n=1 Tax=Condylostylus longicornis TaxID=2530218 RepID=UPI00244E46B9|nr:adipokinetic hormone [Condylostylus longicornis]
MISQKLALFILVITLFLQCNCQLTFTPVWGKRNNGAIYGTGVQNENCKSSTEILLDIFRLIQTESQKFLDCNPKA